MGDCRIGARLSPAIAGSVLIFICYPGACTPGFMLSLASRVYAVEDGNLEKNFHRRVNVTALVDTRDYGRRMRHVVVPCA
jgi:hypothetical protein